MQANEPIQRIKNFVPDADADWNSTDIAFEQPTSQQRPVVNMIAEIACQTDDSQGHTRRVSPDHTRSECTSSEYGEQYQRAQPEIVQIFPQAATK